MMKVASGLIIALEIIAIIWGLYSEFAPAQWLLAGRFPQGMGLALALVGAPMALAALVVDRERADRDARRGVIEVWDRALSHVSICMPTHERDFYSLWSAQIRTAQHAIDVTHLGVLPPQGTNDAAESEYLQQFRDLYRNTRAHVRRVERLTPQKEQWIRQLIEEFEGVEHFSLRVFRDPSSTDMPHAMSVCRVDERFAWIVALAEHHSTTGVRDLLLSGKDAASIVRTYFQERLWERSTIVIDRGVVNRNWQHA
jgi:hypothetical protein